MEYHIKQDCVLFFLYPIRCLMIVFAPLVLMFTLNTQLMLCSQLLGQRSLFHFVSVYIHMCLYLGEYLCLLKTIWSHWYFQFQLVPIVHCIYRLFWLFLIIFHHLYFIYYLVSLLICKPSHYQCWGDTSYQTFRFSKTLIGPTLHIDLLTFVKLKQHPGLYPHPGCHRSQLWPVLQQYLNPWPLFNLFWFQQLTSPINVFSENSFSLSDSCNCFGPPSHVDTPPHTAWVLWISALSHLVFAQSPCTTRTDLALLYLL